MLLEDDIMPAFQDKIDMVRNGYSVSEEVVIARNTFAIDDFRHPQFPDDVMLIFYQEEL